MPVVAVLDANVLWSAPVRDTLLRAAERDIYHPIWTDEILQEMARSLNAKRPDLDPSRIDRLIDQMTRSFPHALAEGYQALIPHMRNQESDRHVLVAAIVARASVIITWNTRHFPAEACTLYGVDVQTPDTFLCLLWNRNPESLIRILHEQAKALVRPRMTARDPGDNLARFVPRFAEAVDTSGWL